MAEFGERVPENEAWSVCQHRVTERLVIAGQHVVSAGQHRVTECMVIAGQHAVSAGQHTVTC